MADGKRDEWKRQERTGDFSRSSHFVLVRDSEGVVRKRGAGACTKPCGNRLTVGGAVRLGSGIRHTPAARAKIAAFGDEAEALAVRRRTC